MSEIKNVEQQENQRAVEQSAEQVRAEKEEQDALAQDFNNINYSTDKVNDANNTSVEVENNENSNENEYVNEDSEEMDNDFNYEVGEQLEKSEDSEPIDNDSTESLSEDYDKSEDDFRYETDNQNESYTTDFDENEKSSSSNENKDDSSSYSTPEEMNNNLDSSVKEKDSSSSIPENNSDTIDDEEDDFNYSETSSPYNESFTDENSQIGENEWENINYDSGGSSYGTFSESSSEEIDGDFQYVENNEGAENTDNFNYGVYSSEYSANEQPDGEAEFSYENNYESNNIDSSADEDISTENTDVKDSSYDDTPSERNEDFSQKDSVSEVNGSSDNADEGHDAGTSSENFNNEDSSSEGSSIESTGNSEGTSSYGYDTQTDVETTENSYASEGNEYELASKDNVYPEETTPEYNSVENSDDEETAQENINATDSSDDKMTEESGDNNSEIDFTSETSETSSGTNESENEGSIPEESTQDTASDTLESPDNAENNAEPYTVEESENSDTINVNDGSSEQDYSESYKENDINNPSDDLYNSETVKNQEQEDAISPVEDENNFETSSAYDDGNHYNNEISDTEKQSENQSEYSDNSEKTYNDVYGESQDVASSKEQYATPDSHHGEEPINKGFDNSAFREQWEADSYGMSSEEYRQYQRHLGSNKDEKKSENDKAWFSGSNFGAESNPSTASSEVRPTDIKDNSSGFKENKTNLYNQSDSQYVEPTKKQDSTLDYPYGEKRLAANTESAEYKENIADYAETKTEDISNLKDKLYSFIKNEDAGIKEKIDGLKSEMQEITDKYKSEQLSGFLSGEKMNLSIDDSVVFQNNKEFGKSYGNNWRAERINGFNDGKMSYVKLEGEYPLKTGVHEYMHGLSANDNRHFPFKTEYRRGISINGKDKQFNEGLTEYFTKQAMGEKYPSDKPIAYGPNAERIEKMAGGFGQDTLKKAYFQNEPELLVDKYESVMGKGSWQELSKAFDDSMNFSDFNKFYDGNIKCDRLIYKFIDESERRHNG